MSKSPKRYPSGEVTIPMSREEIRRILEEDAARHARAERETVPDLRVAAAVDGAPGQ